MDRSRIPGYAVGVVSEGETVHLRGFGETGAGHRVTPQTPFVLGSTTKSFTALAAMQLVDAGDLDLDAPVRAYVPEFRLADSTIANRITVRQILQQTSGLAETAGGPIVRSAREGTAVDAVRELRGARVISTPGSAFHYSNANYVIAGLIVERASGERYSSYVQRHIFAPLGMDDSFVSYAPARPAGLARGHRFWFGLARSHGPVWRDGIQPAGYLISSARDMSRYLEIYLNDGVARGGRRIVSSRGLRAMLEPARPGRLGPWADHASAHYAMGWYIGGPWSKPAALHPGRTPDSSSMIAIFPKRNLAIVTLANAANQLSVPGYPAPVDRVARNAVDALLGDPIRTGASLPRFYLYFDLVALLLLGLATWSVARAIGRLRSGEPASHRTRAALGTIALAVLGGFLLALPALTLGWSAAFLWQPDLYLLATVLGGLLMTSAILRVPAWFRTGRVTKRDATP